MRRAQRGAAGGSRASALWGNGSRGGEHRSSGLWGSGGRGDDGRASALRGTRGHGLPVLAVAALALALPLSASAGRKDPGKSYVAPAVYQAAKKNEKVAVIVQAADGVTYSKQALAGLGSLKKEFGRMGMVAGEIQAKKLEKLAEVPGLVVTHDALVKKAGSALSLYTSTQLWPHQNGVAKLWGAAGLPAIAIVDSGIDKNHPALLGSRVVARQAFGQSGGSLDGRGHGTFVAGIAAGTAPGFAGAAPGANLVDLDVIDDSGVARTSDVIEAAEWILKNKDAYNIRVANFSLHSASVLSIRFHPLNRVVEKLWFSGVVVVAAAGNYGIEGGPSGVRHAPGNDPFVITVGALDIGGSSRIGDDGMAPWSAYGYTNEGFAKPEVAAAGRYLVGPVPVGSTLAAERADKIVSPGYIQLSGTSFAAPVVAGVAAQMLAANPSWTPDQVKGALMKTARRVPQASLLQQGRGQVNAVKAATAKSPPSGNGALNRFVVGDPSGGLMFNAAAWSDAAWSDKAWDNAAWSDAAWTDAAWTDAAWTDAAWNDAAWNDAAWSDGVAYEDNADDGKSSDVALTTEDKLDLASDPDLLLPGQSLPSTTTVTTSVTAGL